MMSIVLVLPVPGISCILHFFNREKIHRFYLEASNQALLKILYLPLGIFVRLPRASNTGI